MCLDVMQLQIFYFSVLNKLFVMMQNNESYYVYHNPETTGSLGYKFLYLIV